MRPNTGIVLPRSTCDIIGTLLIFLFFYSDFNFFILVLVDNLRTPALDLVTMQAQKEAPPDMQCKDKFLLQSVKTNDGTTAKDINAEMVFFLSDIVDYMSFYDL